MMPIMESGSRKAAGPDLDWPYATRRRARQTTIDAAPDAGEKG